jgi:chromosomal replication initiator protein
MAGLELCVGKGLEQRKREDMQTQGGWILLPENRAARQAVERVLECVCGRAPRRAINPLFVHGPPGSGKTLLAGDLIAQATRRLPDLPVALLQAGDIIAGASGRPEDEDVAAARHAELVVVEDLQHLPARAVELFVGLLDRCLARQRQLVCTAVAGPAQLSDLPGRLTSRLAQGLVVGLEALTPASRRDYLHRRAAERPGSAGANVLDWLAEHTPGSARPLEGALVRLDNLTRALGRSPELAEVIEAFREDAEAGKATVERIAQRVGRYFQVEPRQMCSPRRSRQVLLPRQVGMYLARQLTGMSLEQIGAYFGGRDHSTVLHACRKVEQALHSDPRLSGAVRTLRADLA